MKNTLKILVGQRGVGKSSLLRRLRSYFECQHTLFFDLDDEIEREYGQSIENIFLTQGEKYFRALELQTFQKLIKQIEVGQIFISVGAGFPMLEIPDQAEIIWVRRNSDSTGRIFLDRPRLEKQYEVLEEFFIRANAREQIFKRTYSWIYYIPEGLQTLGHFIDPIHSLEQKIFGGNYHIGTGTVTLDFSPRQFPRRWASFKEKYLGRGLNYVELRSDLLSDSDVKDILPQIKSEGVLLTLRAQSPTEGFLFLKSLALDLTSDNWMDAFSPFHLVDLPLEWFLDDNLELKERSQRDSNLSKIGDYLNTNHKLMISYHGTTKQPLSPTMDSLKELNRFIYIWDQIKLEFENAHLKWAPKCDHLHQVFHLLRWQDGDNKFRNFLPRSLSGEWLWVRGYLKRRQKINFISSGQNDVPDQPNLLNWLNFPEKTKRFAAILGDPVAHSYTPIFHNYFFKKYEMPVFSIRIPQNEFLESLPELRQFGLTAAAVTSPLKKLALGVATQPSATAKRFGSANTIYLAPNEIYAENTDLAGFLILASEITPDISVAVWGGGGTLNILREVLPHAQFYSAQTGILRNPDSPFSKSPDILVWAAPRHPDIKSPPLHWQPDLIIDLNYSEDSMGRELALNIGCEYISGLKMFTTQAIEQQRFWRNHLLQYRIKGADDEC